MGILNSFTYSEYSWILTRLKKAGYHFININADLEFMERQVCLLRHDVDLDVAKALKIAEIEYSMDVRSTYCFMVTNDVYNFFSPSCRAVVEALQKRFHYIGLHVDLSQAKTMRRKQDLCMEQVLLMRSAGVNPCMVSFHRPGELELSGFSMCEGVTNPYSDALTKQMLYRSDSGGSWRYGHPLESEEFANRKSLNILTHPIWWNERRQSAVDTLKHTMHRLRVRDALFMQKNIVGSV